MMPRGPTVENPETEPAPASHEACRAVKCRHKRTYGYERRELFRPTRRQIEDARSWLVRVIARRAVDILKAQETGP